MEMKKEQKKRTD